MSELLFVPVHPDWRLVDLPETPSLVVILPGDSPPSLTFLAALAERVAPAATYVAFIGQDAEVAHDRFDRFVIAQLRACGLQDADAMPMTAFSEAASLEESVAILEDEHLPVMEAFGDACVLGPPEARALLSELFRS